MKQYRTIAILLVVLLALGGLATWDEWKTEQEDKDKANEGKIAQFEPSAVDKIVYASEKSEDDQSDAPEDLKVVLERVDGEWRIIEPVAAKADREAVESLLNTIRDYKYEKVVAEGNFAQYGLEQPNRSIELTLSNGGEASTKVIHIGDKAPVGYSVYLRTDSSEQVLMGSQYLLISTTKSLHDFRDKTFVRIPQDTLQKLTYERKGFDAVVIEREEAGFIITGPGRFEADRNDVIDFVDELNALKAQRFVDQPSAEQKRAFESPGIVITTTTEAGETTKISFVYENGQYLAAHEQQKAMVQLSNDVNSKLSKELLDFRDRRIFKFESADVAEVVIDGERFVNVKGSWFKEGDVDKVDPQSGKVKEGEAIQSASHVRSLLIDLEFAKTRAFLNADTVSPSVVKATPEHSISLKFKEDKASDDLEIELLSRESAETWYVRQNRSDMFFVVPDSAVDSLKASPPQLQDEDGLEDEQDLPYGDEPFDEEFEVDGPVDEGSFEEVPTDSME